MQDFFHPPYLYNSVLFLHQTLEVVNFDHTHFSAWRPHFWGLSMGWTFWILLITKNDGIQSGDSRSGGNCGCLGNRKCRERQYFFRARWGHVFFGCLWIVIPYPYLKQQYRSGTWKQQSWLSFKAKVFHFHGCFKYRIWKIGRLSWRINVSSGLTRPICDKSLLAYPSSFDPLRPFPTSLTHHSFTRPYHTFKLNPICFGWHQIYWVLIQQLCLVYTFENKADAQIIGFGERLSCNGMRETLLCGAVPLTNCESDQVQGS